MACNPRRKTPLFTDANFAALTEANRQRNAVHIARASLNRALATAVAAAAVAGEFKLVALLTKELKSRTP